MAVLFPKTCVVIRRGKGGYVNGIWTPGSEPASEPIELNIQPANSSDYNRTQAIFAGRRVTAMMRAYADIDANLNVAGSDSYPGDIIVYRNQRYLVIGSARHDSLDDESVSHMRYMIALEVEHAAAEVTA